VRLRITSRRYSRQDFDLGAGWHVSRERHGSCTWFYAMLLESPGGYVVNHLYKQFSYRRDADAWVRLHKEILGVAP
jgi:hypothetical protein